MNDQTIVLEASGELSTEAALESSVLRPNRTLFLVVLPFMLLNGSTSGLTGINEVETIENYPKGKRKSVKPPKNLRKAEIQKVPNELF